MFENLLHFECIRILHLVPVDNRKQIIRHMPPTQTNHRNNCRFSMELEVSHVLLAHSTSRSRASTMCLAHSDNSHLTAHICKGLRSVPCQLRNISWAHAYTFYAPYVDIVLIIQECCPGLQLVRNNHPCNRTPHAARGYSEP
jgi:hypothetical protein